MQIASLTENAPLIRDGEQQTIAMKPAELIIIGAGSRGSTYAAYAQEHPELAKVVGVAEPRTARRESLAAAHGVDARNAAAGWREFIGRPRCADAVVIATQDSMHTEPAVAFARMGYHILLEKPMAPDESGCRAIVDAVNSAGVIFAVCHVLRYTVHTRTLKEIIDSGAVGEVISLQSLEPVGYWHQAHSFVRGNWRRSDESCPMLLAKCCHDLDLIRHLMGTPCRKIHSFGGLSHFRPQNKPAGAADRCLDCAAEPGCPYSAVKIYLGRLADGQTGWPLDVLADEVNTQSIAHALRTGPYGRCVYACDNDAVDHQVVAMQFENGATASLTMTAFTRADHRQIRIFGTRGELVSNGRSIRRFDFLTDTWSEIQTAAGDGSILGGHGGGDYALMDTFVDAVRRNDRSRILSGAEESLETHSMVFAAERARQEGTACDI
jgi:predicted dehydrogenase